MQSKKSCSVQIRIQLEQQNPLEDKFFLLLSL